MSLQDSKSSRFPNMKLHSLALILTALTAVPAFAQTPPSRPVSMEPAAQSILDRAVQSYRAASGLRFEQIASYNGKVKPLVLLRYSRPGKLRIDRPVRQKTFTQLYDGANFYDVRGDEYLTKAAPMHGDAPLVFGPAGRAGETIAAMLAGKDPFAQAQRTFSQLPSGQYQSRIVALGARLVDGDMLQGIREEGFVNFKAEADKGEEGKEDKGKEDDSKITTQTTAWFGGSPFALRRLQQRITMQGRTTVVTEKLIDQQFSPTFPADTFVFSSAGLTLNQPDDNAPYFDPRLKVGAAPFPFEAHDRQGRPISLEPYKGKVVLLDFWATWCVPCIQALPEVKSAYNKYHARGLEVVGISLDEDESALTAFLKKQKMSWPQIFDGKGWKTPIAQTYGVRAIPFTLLIGRDGKVAAVNPPEGQLEKAVQKALSAR
ncbi:TlpA family protein disulfide reductase [bacterium]|nr:MAG: TlpA family protein disulfide reductase [bacterium]